MAAGSSECHRQQLHHGARCTTCKFTRHKTTQYRHILQCDSAGPLPVHCRHMHNMGAPMPPPDCRPAWRQGRHTYAVPHLLIFILCDGDSRSICYQAVDQLQHRVETHSPLPWRAIAVFRIWIRRFVHVRTAHMMEVLAALASARLPTSCSIASRPALRCHAAPIARPAEVSAACRASSARTSLTVRCASWSEECTLIQKMPSACH